MLTALDGMRGHLEGDVLSSGLRNVHAEHQTDTRVLPTDICFALPQLDVGVPELQDPDTVDSVRGGTQACVRFDVAWAMAGLSGFSHCFHVVLWLQRDLQHFGAVDDLLKAGGGHRFASDAVNLVEGVRLEDALVRRADEDLKAERLLASVAVQLKHEETEEQTFLHMLTFNSCVFSDVVSHHRGINCKTLIRSLTATVVAAVSSVVQQKWRLSEERGVKLEAGVLLLT